MKKALLLFLLLALTVSLLSCDASEGNVRKKADGTVDYRQGGVEITLPKYLAAEEVEGYALYARYRPEKVEYSVIRVTPEEIEGFGLYPDITAFDYGTLLIDDLGINDFNAEMTGSYETLLPTEDGENAYFAFGDVDLNDENATLYKQIYLRRSDDGSIWLFFGVCDEALMDSYSSLFMTWARMAGFYEE